MRRALFPLPLFILPNGLTRLKIFEPRYMRMVAECVEDLGFVIMSVDKQDTAKQPSWGVLVKIVNFHGLNHGMLAIDVQADSLVAVENITVESDGLQRANVTHKPLWASMSCSLLREEEVVKLSSLLFDFYENNRGVGELYLADQCLTLPLSHCSSSEVWLCQRWIELLPISHRVKRTLIEDGGYRQSIDLLRTLILEK